MFIFQFAVPVPARREEDRIPDVQQHLNLRDDQGRVIRVAAMQVGQLVNDGVSFAITQARNQDNATDHNGNTTRSQLYESARARVAGLQDIGGYYVDPVSRREALAMLDRMFPQNARSGEVPIDQAAREYGPHGGTSGYAPGSYEYRALAGVAGVYRDINTLNTEASRYFGRNGTSMILLNPNQTVGDFVQRGDGTFFRFAKAALANYDRSMEPHDTATTVSSAVPTLTRPTPVHHAPAPIVSDHERRELNNAVRAIPPDLLDRYHITHDQLSAGLADLMADMRRQNRELGPDERLPRAAPMEVAMAIIRSFDRNEPVELRLPGGQSSPVVGAAVSAFAARLRAPGVDDAHAFNFTFSRLNEGYIFGQGWQVELTDRAINGAAPTSAENWTALMTGMRTADQRGDPRFGRALDAMFFGRPTSTHDITRSEYENAASALGITELAPITAPIRRVVDGASLRSLSRMGLQEGEVAQAFADFYAANEPVYMQSRGISADDRIEIMQWAVDFINGGRNSHDTMSFTDQMEFAAVRSLLGQLGMELREAGVDAETGSPAYRIARIGST
ncbi:hypothetical protein HY990_06715 [Candidatus Micrarchaeota archaeon]|nr:hypothetical protein [Candidatus Micrarchaeota archaeon]